MMTTDTELRIDIPCRSFDGSFWRVFDLLAKSLSPKAEAKDDKAHHALFIELKEHQRHANFCDVWAYSVQPSGHHKTPLVMLPPEKLEPLSAAAFLFAGQGGMKGSMPGDFYTRPTYFLTTHGALCFDAEDFPTGRVEESMLRFVPEQLTVYLGRDGSEHDRLILDAQVSAILRSMIIPMTTKDVVYHLTRKDKP